MRTPSRRTALPLALACAAALAAPAAPAAALDLGQNLPANGPDVAFVQGAEFDPGVAEGNAQTLVVFWMSTAPDMPGLFGRLASIAAAHRGLRILAINSVEDAGAVRAYLRDNPCAGVSFAVDPGNATLLRYMPTTGPNQNIQVNLPIAFLADASGRMLWSGDRPLSGLAHVVGQTMGGQWTLATTAQFAQARAEWREALQNNNAAAAYLAIRKLTRLDAGNAANYGQWHRLALAAGEVGELDAIFEGWSRAAADDPEMLLALANSAMAPDNLALRRPRAASAALRQAYATRTDNARFILAVAAGYHRVGNLTAAVKLAHDAITLGAGDIVVGLTAAQLRMTMHGPAQAVKDLEGWKVEPNTDAAKLLAEHLAYYRLLVELAGQPIQ